MYIIIDKEAIDNFYRMYIQSRLRLFRKCFAVSQPPRLLSYFEVGIFIPTTRNMPLAAILKLWSPESFST